METLFFFFTDFWGGIMNPELTVQENLYLNLISDKTGEILRGLETNE